MSQDTSLHTSAQQAYDLILAQLEDNLNQQEQLQGDLLSLLTQRDDADLHLQDVKSNLDNSRLLLTAANARSSDIKMTDREHATTLTDTRQLFIDVVREYRAFINELLHSAKVNEEGVGHQIFPDALIICISYWLVFDYSAYHHLLQASAHSNIPSVAHFHSNLTSMSPWKSSPIFSDVSVYEMLLNVQLLYPGIVLCILNCFMLLTPDQHDDNFIIE